MKDQEKYEVIVQLMKALPVWKEVEGLQMYIVSLGQPLHAALLQRVKRKPLTGWVLVVNQPYAETKVVHTLILSYHSTAQVAS